MYYRFFLLELLSRLNLGRGCPGYHQSIDRSIDRRFLRFKLPHSIISSEHASRDFPRVGRMNTENGAALSQSWKEFQEEEIVFGEEKIRAAVPEREDSVDSRPGKVAGSSPLLRAGNETGSCECRCQSAPVNIPPWPRSQSGSTFTVEEYDEGDDQDRRAPPHELLDRMKSNFMTFSVCEGFGRTLKGRDLSQVRNAVLRQTGFLD